MLFVPRNMEISLVAWALVSCRQWLRTGAGKFLAEFHTFQLRAHRIRNVLPVLPSIPSWGAVQVSGWKPKLSTGRPNSRRTWQIR